MSGVVYQSLERDGGLRGIWAGTIASDPADLDERVMVTLTEVGDGQLQLGPCRWQARDATSLPARGDWCLVAFDQNEEPTVVTWWPFVT